MSETLVIAHYKKNHAKIYKTKSNNYLAEECNSFKEDKTNPNKVLQQEELHWMIPKQDLEQK